MPKRRDKDKMSTWHSGAQAKRNQWNTRRSAVHQSSIPQVGAPDPESKTSPIFDEGDADIPSLDLDIETGGCYFNNVRYSIGQYVRSGEEVLRCEGRGVWVRKGETEEEDE
jgi:hypothetical protein